MGPTKTYLLVNCMDYHKTFKGEKFVDFDKPQNLFPYLTYFSMQGLFLNHTMFLYIMNKPLYRYWLANWN